MIRTALDYLLCYAFAAAVGLCFYSRVAAVLLCCLLSMLFGSVVTIYVVGALKPEKSVLDLPNVPCLGEDEEKP